MNIHYYKPNSRNLGSACSFNFDVENQAFYVSMVKQASWNAETKTGSFKANVKHPTNSLSAKFTLIEAAGFLDAILSNRPFSFYHTIQAIVTRGDFKPYLCREDSTKQLGFSLAITKELKESGTKNSFLIGLDFKEARLLAVFIQRGIEICLEAGKKSKVVEEPAPQSVPAKPAPEPEAEDDIF